VPFSIPIAGTGELSHHSSASIIIEALLEHFPALAWG
jgi:hypothetical protein